MDKIIAVDFDGCLAVNKYPDVGEPIEKNIQKLKDEQKAGAKIILWSCRVGQQLEDALAFCELHEVIFDAVNENLPIITEAYGGDTRKILADEYWDDRAVLMDEKDIGEFSDGYHTFNALYEQRLYLSATLFNSFKEFSWKSWKHSDGELCFGGGWFIIGISTPEGDYTYHYEAEHWELFQCKAIDMAPEWDGHTDKDVKRLLSLLRIKDQMKGNLSPFEAYMQRRGGSYKND